MKRFLLYLVGWVISAVILIPCAMLDLIVGGLDGERYDFHLMYHLWYERKFLSGGRKEFNLVHYEYYFDKPTLFTCRDEESERYVFVLLSDDTDEYIGIWLSAEQLVDFTLGRIDLLTLFMRNRVKHKFYIGQFRSDASFSAVKYRGKVTEDMMPAEGLVIKY